ncbi:hypothetical protein TNCV_2996951 [Trichonephila clavipes]|nr:hypothetical protein TNCV_2996951 [Trichonephila clavipes]
MSKGVMSRNLGDHDNGLPLPIYHSVNFFSLPDPSVVEPHFALYMCTDLNSIHHATTCSCSHGEAILKREF